MIIDKLKNAVSNKNWQLVCEAIEALDGTRIQIDNDQDEFLSKLEALKNEFITKTKKDSPATKVVKEEQTNPNKRPNLFEDMKKDLVIDDEKGSEFIDDSPRPNKQKRAAYNPVSVKCNGCKKSFEVNPIFAKQDYVCDRCVGKKYAQ